MTVRFIILCSQSCELLASGYFRTECSILDNIHFTDLSNLVSKYINMNNDIFQFRIKSNHRYRMLFFPQKSSICINMTQLDCKDCQYGSSFRQCENGYYFQIGLVGF